MRKKGLAKSHIKMEYIDTTTLINWLSDDQTDRSALTLVDIRDDGYDNGHIRGAKSFPASSFHYSVHSLVNALNGSEMIVVVGLQTSDAQGMHCASLLRKILDTRGERARVSVLRGGYDQFIVDCKGAEGLLEGFRAQW